MKNISEKALLVNITISQWSASKYDRKVSREIETEHNARNAGRFNKILIADHLLKEIQKNGNNTRAYVYDNTLPWGNNGDRLLPAVEYLAFMTEFRKLKSLFEAATHKFIIHYPALKDEARLRLNGMFKEDDYPPAGILRTKFSITMETSSIADPQDFRVQVDKQEVDDLRNNIESSIQSKFTQATKNIWTRMRDAISHMVEKLSDQDAIFRDTLVSNIRELVEILPRLNFTEDDDITHILQEMESLLVDPDRLRTNTRLRSDKAREAKAILDKVSNFIG
jgi:hypothetical protein